MSLHSEITTLLEQLNALKANVKDCNVELKVKLSETKIYKEVLEATMNQATAKVKIPEKVAIAHALKVALVSFTEEE